jgi:hypothetical protein
VLAVAPRILVRPGEAFFMRVYMVLGTLEEVAAKSAQLVDHVEYGFLDYDENSAPLLPLYDDRKTGLTSQPPTDKAEPVAYSYAVPVKGSVPLFQLKETATGKVVLSTDPYALCGKKPFANPYSKGDPKYETYQNRVIYQPYDGKTEWLGLLGYVMPEKLAAKKSGCRSLSGVLNDNRSFISGDKPGADELLIRTEK